MAAQDMEGALDALVTKLQSGLSATIATVNSDSSDDHDIEVPADITVSTRAEIPAYPHVMVLPENSNPIQDLGQRILIAHTVRAVVWYQEWDEQALGRKLLRYLRALKDTLIANRDPGAGGYTITWQRDEYGPVFRPDQEGYYLQAASGLYVVKQQRDI